MNGRLGSFVAVFAFASSVGGGSLRAQDLSLEEILAGATDCANVQCTISSQAQPRVGFFSDVFVQADSTVDAGKVSSALSMWNQCNGGAGGKAPTFGTSAPSGSSSYYTVSVTVQPLNAAGDGHCGTRSGNHITIYNFTEVGGQQFPCGDAALTLAHELGHWLGLSDSPNCPDCSDNIMTWLYSNGANLQGRSVQPEDCQKVDENWNMRGEPGGPDPGDRIGRLGGICERVPELCVDANGSPGGNTPWWGYPETSPTYACMTATVTGCAGSDCSSETTTYCSLRFQPVLTANVNPDELSVLGPVTELDLPSGPVHDNWTITGRAFQNPYGVARVALWVDEQPVAATPVYGQASSVGCGGDPNCPNVGFTAVLDTRTLTNGPHLLSAVSADARGTRPGPTRVDIPFEVSNCLDTTPPSVAWSAPASGSTVVGTTTLQATASDNVGVTQVEFYLDNVRLGTDAASPYAFGWNSGAATAGAHQLKAKAYDACGNVAATAQVPVTVVLDTGLPTVSITTPTAGANVRGTLTVAATAADANGVSKVEFRVDGSLVASDTTVPYSFAWNTSALSAGSHSLVARAYDTSNNVGNSAAVSVVVDNRAPNLNVEVPAASAAVSGSAVQVSGWATDATRIAALAFQLDGAPLSLNAAYTYGLSRSDVCTAVPTGDANCPNVGWRAFFDSTRLADGSHTLTTIATDGAGNTFSMQRVFSISNPPNPPTGLAATVLSATSVRLNWTDASGNETQFEVQRRLFPSGAFVAIAATAANVVTYTDNAAAAGTSYEYRVAAKNSVGSGLSNVVSVTTTQIPPVAPSGLAASYNTSTRQFTLTWSDNSNNEQGFAPQFSYSGSAFSDLVNPVGANVTSYVSGANPPTGSYQFRVRAYNAAGSSAYSNTVSLIVAQPQPTTSIAWIQPAESSWGPAGTLTAAGYAANGTGNVTLVWRERSSSGIWGNWVTVGYAATVSPDTTWSNTISSGNPTNKCHWFDAYTVYSGVTSATFHFTGAAGCP